MRNRTDNHVTRYRCKDVAASFAKRRAQLVADAANEGMTVLYDDGKQFRAECFNSSRERIVFEACVQGAPFANGPAIVRSYGKVEYSDLLLPKK